ncbi:carboxypeptidase-like regulatory domain-containing protein [Flavobacterium suncheonense]|uniref:carboxypeptidase-like regulatory domain-containing protein n=1 Tax=Flavobacterium suncheonense TaxID=350894 RepID=UPI003FA37D26
MFHKKGCTLLMFLQTAVWGQINGVVKDSLTGNPIPYVSIWVENETVGTTSEENGTFHLPTDKSKMLIFTALGYEKKRISASQSKVFFMTPKSTDLEELVVVPKKETKFREIGDTGNSFSEAFDSAPSFDLKYFPYQESYKKTKFIKKVVIYTDCRLPKAILKLHFYAVDADGNPGEELLKDEYRVMVKKGVGKSSFNISSLGLTMPKNGIYVGFEKLMIEENHSVGGRFYPLVLYNRVPKEFTLEYAGGKWVKKEVMSRDASLPKKSYEPAINLILSN